MTAAQRKFKVAMLAQTRAKLAETPQTRPPSLLAIYAATVARLSAELEPTA